MIETVQVKINIGIDRRQSGYGKKMELEYFRKLKFIIKK